MSAVFAVLLKDLKVRFSTPIELAFFLILPLLFTVVLSGTPSGKTEARENRPLVLIADGVRSTSSGKLAEALASLPGIRARVTNDPAELLRSSETDLLLWITPSSEGQASFHVAFKPSPWHGVSPAVQRLGALIPTADPLSEDAMRQGFAAAASEPASTPQTVESADPSDRAVTGNAGQIVTWVLVPLLGMGSIFISERRRGTLRRAAASPAGRPALTAGTVAAEFAAAAVQIGLLLLFGSLIYGLPAGAPSPGACPPFPGVLRSRRRPWRRARPCVPHGETGRCHEHQRGHDPGGLRRLLVSVIALSGRLEKSAGFQSGGLGHGWLHVASVAGGKRRRGSSGRAEACPFRAGPPFHRARRIPPSARQHGMNGAIVGE